LNVPLALAEGVQPEPVGEFGHVAIHHAFVNRDRGRDRRPALVLAPEGLHIALPETDLPPTPTNYRKTAAIAPVNMPPETRYLHHGLLGEPGTSPRQ